MWRLRPQLLLLLDEEAHHHLQRIPSIVVAHVGDGFIGIVDLHRFAPFRA
jgi:hypothetical protein